MKDKLIIFVVGLLVGAVISTSAFFIYSKATSTCNNNQNQMQGGQAPSMPNGQNQQNSEGGQPPEKPSDDNNQNNGSTDTNTQNSNSNN